MAAASDGPHLCGVCGKTIDGMDEYIFVTCNRCGTFVADSSCCTAALQRLRTDNSRTQRTARDRARTHPHEVLCQYKVLCIRRSQKPCPGIVSGAQLVRPERHAQVAPRPPRQSAAARKVAAELARQQASQAAGKARSRQQGVKTAPSVAGSDGGGPMHGDSRRRTSMLSFPPGARPRHLKMCRNVEQDGDCHIYRCPYCHNSDELRQREQEWQAAQEAKRRAERQRELEAATAEAGGGAVAADYLQLSSASVSLLKAWKERQCLAALAELGFDPATAKAAAAATGSDADRAVALLLDGGIASGSKPVLVTAEAQELLSFATSLGLGLEDVEMAILMAQGDPEVAKEGLQSQRFGQAAVDEARALSQASTGAFLSQHSDPGLVHSYAGSIGYAPTASASYAGSTAASVGGPDAAALEEAAWASAASALAARTPSPYAPALPGAQPQPEESTASASTAAGEAAWENAGWSFDSEDVPAGGRSGGGTDTELPPALADYLAPVAWPAGADGWPAAGSGHSTASFSVPVRVPAHAVPPAAYALPSPTGIVASALPAPTFAGSDGWSSSADPSAPWARSAPASPAPVPIPLTASAASQPAPPVLWAEPTKGAVVDNGGDEAELSSLLQMLGVEG